MNKNHKNLLNVLCEMGIPNETAQEYVRVLILVDHDFRTEAREDWLRTAIGQAAVEEIREQIPFAARLTQNLQ